VATATRTHWREGGLRCHCASRINRRVSGSNPWRP
jgi:hypothetical protein